MNHIKIIAEAGVNHNGDYDLALKMVDAAKVAGADYIKFQTAKPELVISRYAEMAEYQKTNIGHVGSQLDMCKKIHLSLSAYKPLQEYCTKVGIKFISTPFDLTSIDVLDDIPMDFWKIPSGEITNYPYLVKIANTRKNVIMSTGMCELHEIETALNVLTSNGLEHNQIQLLHCNTEYPTPMQDVNLKAMEEMREHFHLPVGYSDHTRGIEIPIAAAALGATVIEKHFTLSRNMTGPDHKASLEPQELKAMVSAIRNIEKAMGNGHKEVSDSERKNIIIARKSIVASKNIKKGEILTKDNLYVKRPGNGISPMKWNEVLGTRAIRDFKEDELIEL